LYRSVVRKTILARELQSKVRQISSIIQTPWQYDKIKEVIYGLSFITEKVHIFYKWKIDTDKQVPIYNNIIRTHIIYYPALPGITRPSCTRHLKHMSVPNVSSLSALINSYFTYFLQMELHFV